MRRSSEKRGARKFCFWRPLKKILTPLLISSEVYIDLLVAVRLFFSGREKFPCRPTKINYPAGKSLNKVFVYINEVFVYIFESFIYISETFE